MFPGILNRVEKMMGGVLHHCCFCRIQFFDRRKMAPRTFLDSVPEPARDDAAEPEVIPPTEPQDTASSDA